MVRYVGAIAVMLALLVPAASAPETPPLAVVVHRARHAELSVADLAQVYLRRKRFWDDGTPIVPLNLPAGTPLRVAFSRLVLQRSDADLADYWNRQYFYGILPPATLASTAAVVRYVAAEPNAIGYVPLSEVDDSVTVLLRVAP
jgi:hypothetical protein